MIGERQIVHHKMTQEQIAKELCGVYHGGDRSSKRKICVLQEQVAKELCGVGKGNNQWTRKICVSTQEQIAKELGVFIMVTI